MGIAASARQTAEETSELLSGLDAIRGVLLFGSVARGKNESDSDIDMLVVGVDPKITGRALRAALPAQLRQSHLSLQYMTEDELGRLFEVGPSFTEHLRREGVILYDENGSLKKTVTSPVRHSISIGDEISMQLGRLRPIEDWPQYNGNHLACLAQLYGVSKAIVILVLLSSGIVEFDHRSIFNAYKELYPDRTEDADTVAELAAFSRLIAGHRSELPFSYRNAEPRARAAVAAIRRLAMP